MSAHWAHSNVCSCTQVAATLDAIMFNHAIASGLYLQSDLLQIWWGIGSMFGALLAYGVMRPGGLGWHWYLGLAATPLAIVLLLFPVKQIYCIYMYIQAKNNTIIMCIQFVPESARYSVVKGQSLKAKRALKKVALYNCKQPLEVKSTLKNIFITVKVNQTGQSIYH